MIKNLLLTTVLGVISAGFCSNEVMSNPVKQAKPNTSGFYSISWKYCVPDGVIQELGFYPFQRQQPNNCASSPFPTVVWADEPPEVELWILPSSYESRTSPIKTDTYTVVFRGRGCATKWIQPGPVGWYMNGPHIGFNREYTKGTGQIKMSELKVEKLNLPQNTYREQAIYNNTRPGCDFIRETRHPQ